MKRLFLIALSCLFLIGWTMPVSAAEISSQDKFNRYEEKGQIVFDEVKLTQKDGKLKIMPGSDGEQAQLLEENLDNPEIREVLSEYMAQGKTPVAIGWTRVYLKEDSTGKAVVPMTIDDMNATLELQSSGTGTPTKKGNFTLYTMVGYDNYNPSALYANSVGIWSGGSSGNNGPANNNDDFITMTWPNRHVLLSSTVYGACTSPYKHDEGYSSVVWGFGEKTGTVQLATNGRDDGSSGTRKWVSKYVHTWEKTVPSFIFTTSDVGIMLTNANASWQIASSVIF